MPESLPARPERRGEERVCGGLPFLAGACCVFVCFSVYRGAFERERVSLFICLCEQLPSHTSRVCICAHMEMVSKHGPHTRMCLAQVPDSSVVRNTLVCCMAAKRRSFPESDHLRDLPGAQQWQQANNLSSI